MKIAKSLEDSGLLMKAVTQSKMKQKEKRDRFLGILLGTSTASLLGNILAGKGLF